MSFWKDRWEDIRGNLLWQILVSAFGGGLLTGIAQAVRTAQNHPLEWKGALLLFVVSALGLTVVTLLAARSRTQVQQGAQSLTTTSAAKGRLGAEVVAEYYHRINPLFSKELEDSIRREANKVPVGGERETYLCRALTVLAIYIEFETLWYNIFASQIRALQRLNEISLKREDLFTFYTAAAIESPHTYATYSFDKWLGFLRARILIREDGDMISITIRGRDFLKFLLDEGRSASGRTL